MIVLPAIGSQMITTTSLFLMPVLINSLESKAGLSARAAGFLLSMELVTSAFTTMLFSACYRGPSRRRLALTGGCVTIAATAATLISPSLSILFTTRLIAGIGAGIVGAEAASVLARAVEREKLITIVTIASIVNAAVWLGLLPYIIDWLGYRGSYACLLLIGCAGTYLLRRLPSYPGSPRASSESRSPFKAVGFCVIVAIFLTQLGQGAFWSLEVVYGQQAGLSGHAMGILLSIVTLLLLLGAAASGSISNRLGLLRSLLILIGTNALSILLIATATIAWIFVSANLLQSLTNLSSVICQLALAASLDRTGRVVAVSTSLVTLGNGLGPSLATSLRGELGTPSMGIIVLAFNIVALMLYGVVKLSEDQTSPLPARIT